MAAHFSARLHVDQHPAVDRVVLDVARRSSQRHGSYNPAARRIDHRLASAGLVRDEHRTGLWVVRDPVREVAGRRPGQDLVRPLVDRHELPGVCGGYVHAPQPRHDQRPVRARDARDTPNDPSRERVDDRQPAVAQVGEEQPVPRRIDARVVKARGGARKRQVLEQLERKPAPTRAVPTARVNRREDDHGAHEETRSTAEGKPHHADRPNVAPNQACVSDPAHGAARARVEHDAIEHQARAFVSQPPIPRSRPRRHNRLARPA